MDIGKKLVSAIVAVVLAVCLCPPLALAAPELTATGALTIQSVSLTQDQAVQWAKDRAETHWYINDGSNETQCVEFVQEYYRQLSGRSVGGHGFDYLGDAYGARLDGWTRPDKSEVQPGDIVIWDKGAYVREDRTDWADWDYGHIGIVVSVSGNSMVTAETHAGTNITLPDGTVEIGACDYKYNREVSCISGLLRPDWPSSENPITVSSADKSLKASAVKGAAKGVYPFTVANAATSYSFVDAGSDERLSVAPDGKVTVEKGTPVGSYKAKVTLHADGSARYKAKDLSAEATIKVVSTAAYKVKFVANGGKGTMRSQTVARGKSAALNANKFTRSGYKFAGWNTKANGKGKTYKNKARVKNLAKAGKTAKLYAQWKRTSSALPLPKAKKVYSSALEDLKAKNHRIYYKFADIVGDKTVELVAYAFPNEGMWSHDYVYTIESGKPKLVYDRSNYGYWSNLTYRKGVKSLVYYGSGHGGDSYLYLKFSGGKYKAVARKTRSWGSSSWSFSKLNGADTTPISESAFNDMVNRLVKGIGVELDLGWNTMMTITNDANR